MASGLLHCFDYFLLVIKGRLRINLFQEYPLTDQEFGKFREFLRREFNKIRLPCNSDGGIWIPEMSRKIEIAKAK